MKEKMQWSGEIWSLEYPSRIDRLQEVFPSTLFNQYDVNINQYGPSNSGFLNRPADRDSENGPIVMNYAYADASRVDKNNYQYAGTRYANSTNATKNFADYTDDHKNYMKNLTAHLEASGLFGSAITHFKLEEVVNGTVGTIIFSGPAGYKAFENATQDFDINVASNEAHGSI